MEDKDLNYLFNNVPLYTKEIFEVFYEENNQYYLNENELDRLQKYISTKNQKIITNCIWCDKEFSFKYDRTMYKVNYNGVFASETTINITNDKQYPAYIYLSINNIEGYQPPYDKEIMTTKNYYINYSLACSHEIEHCYYMSVFVRVEKGKFIVMKIGQYPSILSVKGFDFDKFKKQLKKYAAYEDYKNSELSLANGFTVGAYTYLRRVYEKQLNYYIEKDKIILQDNHTETKIKAVKSNFDTRINPLLEDLYRILSKGIHELDEEECKDYYEYLKAVINMQLQHEKEKYEEEQQSKVLTKAISNIAQRLKKK